MRTSLSPVKDSREVSLLNYFRVIKNLTLNELRIFLRSPGALFFALFFPLTVAIFMAISSGTKGRFGPTSPALDNSIISQELGSGKIGTPKEMEKFFKGVQIFKKGGDIVVKGKDPLKVRVAADLIRGKLYRELVEEGKAKVKVVEVVESSGQRSSDPLSFVFVGIIVMALLSGGLLRVGQTVVFSKDGGLLRLYAATPLPKWVYGIALSFSAMIIALLQAFILLGIGVAFFSINYKLNVLVIIPLLLASLSFASLGFLAGGIARTRETFFAIINLLNMFLLFFSSLFYNIYSVGGVIAKVAYIMPTSAAADSLRKIMLSSGSTMEKFVSIIPQILILAVWAMVGYTLAAFTFKWTEEV